MGMVRKMRVKLGGFWVVKWKCRGNFWARMWRNKIAVETFTVAR